MHISNSIQTCDPSMPLREVELQVFLDIKMSQRPLKKNWMRIRKGLLRLPSIQQVAIKVVGSVEDDFNGRFAEYLRPLPVIITYRHM